MDRWPWRKIKYGFVIYSFLGGLIIGDVMVADMGNEYWDDYLAILSISSFLGVIFTVGSAFNPPFTKFSWDANPFNLKQYHQFIYFTGQTFSSFGLGYIVSCVIGLSAFEPGGLLTALLGLGLMVGCACSQFLFSGRLKD